MSRPPLLFRPSAEPPDPQDTGPAEGTPAGNPVPRATAVRVAADSSAAIAEVFPAETDSLSSFGSEDDTQYDREIRYKTQRRPSTNSPGPFVVVLAAGVVVGILALAYLMLRGPSAPQVAESRTASPAVAMGQAQFDSRPSGADVVIDGAVRGKTPLKLSLPVGSHTLEMRGEAGSRTLPLTIDAGVLVSQYVELLGGGDQGTGRLEITSDPAGAQVRVDGVLKGVTPLSLDAVESREHNISLSRGTSTVLRTVKVTPGATASVFASLGATPAAAGAVGGFIELTSPLEMQVLEGGRLIGTTSTERLMVPTGRHQLELVNSAFQFRTAVTLDVEAGKVATATVPIPNGSLSANALPWAEVFVDGRAVGTTPLANLALPIGNHEVVWRHPQLGERRQTVAVTAQTPVRLGVNFAQ